MKLPIRGRILVLDTTIETILHKHTYPDLVGQILAEAVVFAGLMSTSLKHDGIFTLQTKSDGPIQLLVADITQNGTTRGYAEFDQDQIAELTKTNESISLPRLLGKGQLALTLDQSNLKERYQGLVNLEGVTLAQSLQHYFTQSEQLKTALFLASSHTNQKWRAGGLLIQLMPQSDDDDLSQKEDDWHTSISLMSSIRKTELLSEQLTPHDILFRLFHEYDVKVFEPKDIQAGCRCNRERIESILRHMPPQDRHDLVDNQKITITCQFCNEHYEFNINEVNTL